MRRDRFSQYGISDRYQGNTPKAAKVGAYNIFIPPIRQNRGLYHDGWMASDISLVPWEAAHKDVDPDHQKWELYNIENDFSQAGDLATTNPEKLRELQDPSSRADRVWPAMRKHSLTTRVKSDCPRRPRAC